MYYRFLIYFSFVHIKKFIYIKPSSWNPGGGKYNIKKFLKNLTTENSYMIRKLMKEYKDKVNILNDTLKKEESIYEVSLIPENKISELLVMFPNQFVNYSGTGTAVYDESYFGAI